MPRQQPNPLQKLVRGIDDINNTRQSPSPKTAKKSELTRQSKSTSRETEKPSRYIPASIRVDVLIRDGYKCVFCAHQINLKLDPKPSIESVWDYRHYKDYLLGDNWKSIPSHPSPPVTPQSSQLPKFHRQFLTSHRHLRGHSYRN